MKLIDRVIPHICFAFEPRRIGGVLMRFWRRLSELHGKNNKYNLRTGAGKKRAFAFDLMGGIIMPQAIGFLAPLAEKR